MHMDDMLSGNDLRDYEKAKRYFQSRNRYLAFKEQLNTRTRPEEIISAILRQQRQHSLLPSTSLM